MMKESHIFPFLWMRGEEEHILREEIEKIYECGIRAVCVEARPHDDFCGPGWWHDMDIVIDEAKKRDMRIWILDDKHFPTGYANGLIEKKYPERKKLYIACTTADLFGSSHRLTLNISRMLRPAIGYWDLGKPVNEEERAKNQLYAILAVKYAEGNIFREEVVDLTDTFDGTFATFELPEGQWRVHVIYQTRTDGGDETYINLIDAESAHTQIEGVYESHYEKYSEEFGKTIAGFFSDEPQFGNVIAFNSFDTQVGRMKMQLPWSAELEERLTEKYGEELAKCLPFLFAESEEKMIRNQIRYDYMDQVSRLYKKNFSDAIGSWCEAHGVEYIGHVVEDNGLHSRLGMGAAHYFRAMSGQHMAGIDCIGGQVIYGAPNLLRKGMVEGDGEFYHYALGKMGASDGHLDPKKQGRTMCELFGAYGWSFGVRDMKYVLEHLLVKGVNYLVPHAFSMAEYPDHDCPPHFYARGNNPEFPYFAELMKYGNRMCELLSGGQHAASVAVLYDGEADWNGQNLPMQKICRQLIEHQIDFDIVSLDMLADLPSYHGKLEGKKLTVNGVEFQALLVGYSAQVPEALAEFAERAGEFPVIFVNGKPDKILGSMWNGGKSGEKAFARCENMDLPELAKKLKEKGFYDIEIDREFPELSFYHYIKDRQIFVFQNESAYDTFSGIVTLPTSEAVVYYDGFRDTYELAEYEQAGYDCGEGTIRVNLELQPGECIVLMEKKEIACNIIHTPFSRQTEGMRGKDISLCWKVGRGSAKAYPNMTETQVMEELVPVSEMDPAFSGVIRYEKTLNLEKLPKKAVIRAEHVYEVMKVTVNGETAGIRLAPPYQLEVDHYLKCGENQIVIEVATTPARDQMNYPMPAFDFSHEALEPTGMFGKIELLSL